ncbi:MAG: flavin monoamine oxidase family protein [Stellaceae bacterium]
MSRSLYARLHLRFGQPISGSDQKRLVRDRIAWFKRRFPIEQWLAASEAAPKSRRPRVVIVGGGFAGLMAGFILANSHKVTVFEARPRVGGRVWSWIDGRSKQITEAGGEFIGYAHPLWMSLAEHFELGLSMITDDDDYAALNLEMPTHFDGRLLSAKTVERIYDEMTGAIALLSRDARSLIKPYRPWLGPHAARWDRLPVSDWIDKLDASPLAKAMIKTQFANNNGVPASRQSYLGVLALIAGAQRAQAGKEEHDDSYFTQTENVRCESGNQSLAFRLAETIERQGDEVKLSNWVKSIAVHARGVTVTPRHGRPVTADHAVLAVPPSAWDRIKIDPPIDPSYRMSMGTVVKYFSTVRTRFWFADKLSPNSTSENFGMTWDATDNQMQAPGQNVRFALFAGGNAAERALSVYGKSRPERLHRFYDRHIGEVYKAYPSSRARWPRFVAWPQEPWTWGGYSCPAPGEVTRIGKFLSQPFCRHLHFAGEHVCLPFYGFMEGALQSGAMAAKAILGS